MTQNGFETYCITGKAHLVKKWYLDPNININNGMGYPLRVAMKSGSIETVKIILSHPKIQFFEDKTAGPFHSAIGAGNLEIVKLIVGAGANIMMPHMLFTLQNLGSKEIIDYFLEDSKVIDYIINYENGKFINILPEEVTNMFVF